MSNELVPGAFYWVQPVFDVDFDPSRNQDLSDDAKLQVMQDHWHNAEQPARFDGYEADGTQRWIFLGEEFCAWPVCWVGKRITKD